MQWEMLINITHIKKAKSINTLGFSLDRYCLIQVAGLTASFQVCPEASHQLADFW